MNKAAWQFEHSIECAANRSFVWSFWTDISNWERLEGNAVEWIRLHGPFAEGTSGETKMPGQDAILWEIVRLDHERWAKIEMPLDGAIFCNVMRFEAITPDQTRITQRMFLYGDKASFLAEGMQPFAENAPQGLAKLVYEIEAAFKNEK